MHAADMQNNPPRIARAQPRNINVQLFVAGAACGNGKFIDNGVTATGCGTKIRAGGDIVG